VKSIIGKSGYKARTEEVMEMLGVKQLPPEGMECQNVQGLMVWVKPAPEPRYYPESSAFIGRRKIIKTSKHRIMVICPGCHKNVSAGRTHQHRCFHTGMRVRYESTSVVGKVIKPGPEYTVVFWDNHYANSVIHNPSLIKE